MNVSHGLCKVYDGKSIPTFVVPEGAIVVLLQNRHEDDPYVRQNKAMLGEVTRAPSSLKRNFTVPHPTSVKQDILRLIDDKTFQLNVLERSHSIIRADAATYGRYQFKTFPAGVEAPNLQLIPRDQRYIMQGMDLVNVTNRSRPRSLLNDTIRMSGYSLQQLVEYGRQTDGPKGQYTIVFSFSCQEYIPYIEKKRKWSHAFSNEIRGKTFDELFYGIRYREMENDTKYNRARPVKTRKVESSQTSRVATRHGGSSEKREVPISSETLQIRPINMTTLRENILSNMLQELNLNSNLKLEKSRKNRRAVYEDVEMENALK